MRNVTATVALTALVLVLSPLFGAPALHAQESQDTDLTATATMRDTDGEIVGRVTLTQTPEQGVFLLADFAGAEPGSHAFHIHETGSCSPTFDASGGHFNPWGAAHGLLHEDGMHAGDMLNLHVPESGDILTERVASMVTLKPSGAHSLFDEDGAALVVHRNPDDYISQPSGGGGPKLYCGVIER